MIIVLFIVNKLVIIHQSVFLNYMEDNISKKYLYEKLELMQDWNWQQILIQIQL